MSFLLASWISTQVWSWDATPTATAYRLYYSGLATQWCELQFVEYPATTACDASSCEAYIPMPSGDAVYFLVSAVNEAGEGPLSDPGADRDTGSCP